MKKILPLLVLTGILTLFTSCVYVGPVYHETYDFTFNNNTIWNVYDWYLKDSDGHNHSKNGDRYNKVSALSKSTYHDLYKDYYTVIFSYESRPDFFDYYASAYDVYLNTDTEYKLLQDDFYEKRAAVVSGEEVVNEPNFYLVDSEGNRIEMVKIEK